MSNYLLKTGQICERCLPEKDGGKRQEKDGMGKGKKGQVQILAYANAPNWNIPHFCT